MSIWAPAAAGDLRWVPRQLTASSQPHSMESRDALSWSSAPPCGPSAVARS